MTLSSTESELVVYSEGTQTVRFSQQLLEEITGAMVKAVIFEDKQGCIL